MRVLTLLCALGLPLAACAVVLPDAVPPGPAPVPLADLGPCGGNALHALVGRPVSTLPHKGTWGALRVIGPGMMVTTDYSAARLNARVTDAGNILDLNCG